MEIEEFQLCSSIFRNSTIGMIVIAQSSKVLLVNAAFSEVLGKSISEILGTNIEHHAPPNDIPVYDTLLEELRSMAIGSESFSLPHCQNFEHANGTPVLCTGKASIIRDVDGLPALLYAIDHHEVGVIASDIKRPARLPLRSTNTRPARTVLLVEDDALVRKSTRRVLKSLGYNVLQASNGIEALAAVDAFNGVVDVVITDVVMPKMNGTELASELTKRCPTQHVLFVSGHTEETIAHGGLLPTGAFFLQKPFGTRELSDKLGGILD